MNEEVIQAKEEANLHKFKMDELANELSALHLIVAEKDMVTLDLTARLEQTMTEVSVILIADKEKSAKIDALDGLVAELRAQIERLVLEKVSTKFISVAYSWPG
jgi:DNA-binding Xre family transcriptional regulator